MTTSTFDAEEDAYVEQALPTATRNTAELNVDRSPMNEVFLKFRVEVSGTVRSAKLRLHSIGDTTDGPEVFSTDSSWSEATVTWNTRPARDASSLDDSGPVARGEWIEFDVTPAVKASGVVSFTLVPSSTNGLAVHSSESSSASLRPQLVLTTDDSTTPPPPPPPPPPEGDRLTFSPRADASVGETTPDQNNGSSPELLVDGSPRQETYLRFSVTGLSNPVSSAKLRLWVTNETSDGPALFKTSSAWTEAGITWNNRPDVAGAALADLGPVPSGSWIEVEVTAAVAGNGEVAFVLLPTSSNGVDFLSRQAAETDRRPQLVVSQAGQADTCQPRTDTASRSVVNGSEYVREASPDTSYRTSTVLSVDGSPREEIFLRFYVSRGAYHVKRATLRLYATGNTSDGPALYETTPWCCGDLTWNTRPSTLGSSLGDTDALSAGEFVSYDLTAFVRSRFEATAEDALELHLSLQPTSGDSMQFVANYYGGQPFEQVPQLLVELESDPYCTHVGDGGELTAAEHLGGPAREELRSLERDANGGYLALAAVPGDYGAGPLASPDPQDAVIRFTDERRVVWSRVLPPGVFASEVAVTPLGNALVVGSYVGAPDLGAGPLPYAAESSTFVLKLSPSGNTTWSRGFSAQDSAGQPMKVWATGVTTDSDGHAIVYGSLFGSADFGGGLLESGKTPPEDPTDYDRGAPFLFELTWEGHHLWSRVFRAHDGYGGAAINDASTDPAGNVFITGVHTGGTDFGDGVAHVGQGRLPYVASFSSAGTLQWTRVMEGGSGWGSQLEALPNGSVVFSVSYSGSFMFLGEQRTSTCRSPDCTDELIGSLSATGDDAWAKDKLVTRALLAVDEEGAIGVTGRTGLGTDFGGGAISSGARSNRFVARFRPDGAHLWSRVLPEGPFSTEIEGAPGGGFELIQVFTESTEFDGQTYTSRGNTDLLWLRFGP